MSEEKIIERICFREPLPDEVMRLDCLRIVAGCYLRQHEDRTAAHLVEDAKVLLAFVKEKTE